MSAWLTSPSASAARPWPVLLLAGCLLLLGAGESRAQGPSFLDKPIANWLKELKHKESSVRRSAAFALGQMGDDAWYAVPDLAFLLRNDSDAGVREAAAMAVGDILVNFQGDQVPLWDKTGAELLRMLEHDSNPRIRRSAAYALGAFGKRARGCEPYLRKALSDKDPSVRQNAAWALGRFGTLTGATISDLCDRLEDDNTLVRRDAAGALGALGRGAGKPAARALLRAVKREANDVVRRSALDSLARLVGPENKDQAAELYPLLESKDLDTARGAAFVLGNIGEEVGDRPVPVLLGALADSDPEVQALAAASLSGLGPHAAPAVGELARTLTVSQDLMTRRNCAVALSKIGPKARNAVPALAEAMKVRPDAPKTGEKGRLSEEVREFAAEAIGQIGYPDNEKAISTVRDLLLTDTNPGVRQRCVWALFKLRDLDSHNLVPVLEKILTETSAEAAVVRYDSARLLAWALEEKAPDKTVEVLMEMLTNKTLRVYNRSDATVEGTGGEANRGTTAVRPDLGGDARYMAAQALGWLKGKVSKNKAVLEALKAAETAKDSDEELKKRAKEALERLEAR
jgi:HEAT repeat protein